MKISVLTPSFNSVKFIKRAIESVLRQDYKNWEHIIIDGGSADGTVDILKGYKHLKWESTPDRGQSDAMNKAFKQSTGNLIIYLNADDELAEGLFARMVSHFLAHPKVDMIVGNLIVQKKESVSKSVPSIALSDIIKYDLFKFPLNPACYMYKRALQFRIGDFPVENHYVMDYWFLLRAYTFGNVHKIDFECGTFHFDGSNKSADFDRAIWNLQLAKSEFLRKYFLHPKVFTSWVKSNLPSLAYSKAIVLKLIRPFR